MSNVFLGHRGFLPRFLLLVSLAYPAAAEAQAPACDVAAARPWITRWLEAWELTSRDILKLPDAPAPNIVFYDSACVYTTSAISAPGATVVDGPALRGTKLSWRAMAHDDSLTLPDGSRVPVQLMSFMSNDKKTGPYFVMAAPGYWAQKGHADEGGLSGVFLHEFTHTRQLRGVGHLIGPIDSTWSYPEELDDDAVQRHFGSDSVYVAAYRAERDLFERAAAAATPGEARTLAKEGLAMIKRRHARWFNGTKAEFAILDDTFLSMEGAAQWAAAAWLAHPKGGGLTREAAVAKMLGKRRWWVQDEGLQIFLVVDRLVPGWPLLVFNEPAMGTIALLERAVQ
jgi:hypothetical protein